MSATVGIVVAGPPASGKKTLARALISLNAGDGHSTGIPELVSSGCGPLALPLRTKYYTAATELRLVPSSEWQTPGAAAASALRGAEALLLVCDASVEGGAGGADSANALSAWAAMAAEAGIEGCLLLIANKADCAANAAGTCLPWEDDAATAENDVDAHAPLTDAPLQSAAAAAAASARVAAIAWCAENGFEYVDCAATQSMAGASGREKASVARVLEALQANMWSNHVRATVDGASAVTAAVAAPRNAPAASSVAVDDDEHGDPAAALLRAALGEPGLAAGGADDEGELMRLMEEARRLRAASQAGTLDDAQRRAAAADVTLRLLAMLGAGGLGDEEEEDGDSDAGRPDGEQR